jgi:hypothetical protein
MDEGKCKDVEEAGVSSKYFIFNKRYLVALFIIGHDQRPNVEAVPGYINYFRVLTDLIANAPIGCTSLFLRVAIDRFFLCYGINSVFIHVKAVELQ